MWKIICRNISDVEHQLIKGKQTESCKASKHLLNLKPSWVVRAERRWVRITTTRSALRDTPVRTRSRRPTGSSPWSITQTRISSPEPRRGSKRSQRLMKSSVIPTRERLLTGTETVPGATAGEITSHFCLRVRKYFPFSGREVEECGDLLMTSTGLLTFILRILSISSEHSLLATILSTILSWTRWMVSSVTIRSTINTTQIFSFLPSRVSTAPTFTWVSSMICQRAPRPAPQHSRRGTEEQSTSPGLSSEVTGVWGGRWGSGLPQPAGATRSRRTAGPDTRPGWGDNTHSSARLRGPGGQDSPGSPAGVLHRERGGGNRTGPQPERLGAPGNRVTITTISILNTLNILNILNIINILNILNLSIRNRGEM